MVRAMLVLALASLAFLQAQGSPVDMPAWACTLENKPPAHAAAITGTVNLHAAATNATGEQKVQAVNSASLTTMMKEGKADLLVVFYAPWCGHCKQFVMEGGSDAPIEVLRRNLKEKNGATVVKFNVDEDQPPAGFDVKYIPTIYLVKKDGTRVAYKGNPHDLKELEDFTTAFEVKPFGSKSTVVGKVLPAETPKKSLATTGRIATKRQRLSLDNNQKVYIENQPVLGGGAGDGALGECRSIAPQHVANPDAPAVKVCGTNIKATFYLMNRCKGYYEHSKTLGQCDTGMPPTTCDSWSPANDARFGHYQSYQIDPC